MPSPEHLAILKRGVREWNEWRYRNADISPDLSNADLSDAHLEGINFSRTALNDAFLREADLSRADLRDADLWHANLRKADLSRANLAGAQLYTSRLWRGNLCDAVLTQANLSRAKLEEAKLTNSDWTGAQLRETNLARADLRGANLEGAHLCNAVLTDSDLSAAKLDNADITGAILIGTNLQKANLTGCRIYGVSAWKLNLTDTIQKNIIITPEEEPTIQVDRFDIAQFLYLILNNAEIRSVIDTITSKVVLILGRFTAQRKPVLDALRIALRQRDYLPVLFDFEKPLNRDLTETVSTLAHLSKFVIADLTDAQSIPQELMAIVPNLPSVPIQPLLLASQGEYGMFEHFKRYPWVLPVILYETDEELLNGLERTVIGAAEAKVKEIQAQP